ncbi:hypothetical protein JX265_003668 [Neoarthrinium moseri]|uniref:RanBD1 domain-containing protein n=1 Tax=Neoarthrinium moseri TaxID=1658444 RepID=A0A9P9WT68_9PEZI|nr:hypothetical protein JX266_001150 [Neoarthrinium moseri]KAI1877660.1 hypothetical protein JX265_003668 [Neoarthrinium moseri]
MADKAATAAAAASDNKRSPSPGRIKPPAEDPDTAAARKEFDNTAISEKQSAAAAAAAMSASDQPAAAKKATPELEIPDNKNDLMKEQISSPKKKRAHDELDQNKDPHQDPNGDVSPIAANGTASTGRNNRSEPEKKRHRDISSETKPADNQTTETGQAKDSSASKDTTAEAKVDKPSADKSAPVPTSAFGSSGLASFATSSSPFLQAAGSKPLTSFASASGSASPFGAAASTKSDTPSLFGSGSSTNGASPFGSVGGASAKPFGGSVFGTGFGGGLGSSKLTSFAKPGETFKSSKPAKAFGAPDSDPESDEEDNADEADSNAGAEEEKQEKEEKDAEGDKKRTKLQRVAVDDGEAGEATVLQMRAKIFYLDKTVDPMAWKERGAGVLKINVPQQCIDVDDDGLVIPGSFDASSLEDGDVKTVRLIMRQDSTHRLILNTTLIPAMTFQEKPMNKTVCVLFTAIEGEGQANSIQLKLNPTNAKSFVNEVGKIQRELQSS